MRSSSVTSEDSDTDGSIYTPLSRKTSRARNAQGSPPVGKDDKDSARVRTMGSVVYNRPFQSFRSCCIGDSGSSADDEDELLSSLVHTTKPKREDGGRQGRRDGRKRDFSSAQFNKSVWFLRVEIPAPPRTFGSGLIQRDRISVAGSAHLDSSQRRRRNHSSAELLQAFGAHLHRQNRDIMITRNASQAVRRDLPEPVRNPSASLIPSNPTSSGSTFEGTRASRIQRLQSRDNQNATSTLTSDQDLLAESEYEILSGRTSIINGESGWSSNDTELDDGDETSSVASQGSEHSDDVVEETESPLAKRPRADLDSSPKPQSQSTRTQPGTAAPRAADRWTYREGVKGALPPISKIDEIFLDMTTKAWNYLGLQPAVQDLVQRKLRVATMCSGTESPLLALQMINTALNSIDGQTLEIDHSFSAEIVPYKQAYIERNFKPKIMFRDIRELSKPETDQASTAYGGLAVIPCDIDILVAGFSCVDFSNQNNKKRSLAERGESGDTFRAILQYAKKYRPSIIILENVLNAPWDVIQQIWQGEANSAFEDTSAFWGEDQAYSAKHVKLDSKLYYIPHTRLRGYMICIDRQKFIDAEAVTELWASLMKNFQRPASSSVEDFLLRDDDNRARQAQEEMRSTRGTDKAPREVDWDLSRGRHHDYRLLHELGTGRPITGWVDGGSCTFPDFWSLAWAKAQVERIWDSFEISFLRNVVRGFDSQYKARVWELSQNIDRFEDMTPFGVTNCIMPAGIPFLTTRGGPLVGLEALSLQGLPIDRLILTRETQKELQDLAGNAMTSTVVGAAILGALIVGYSALGGKSQRSLGDNPDHASDFAEFDVTSLRHIPLDLISHQHTRTADLCAMAARSIRLCQCEGVSSVTTRILRVCEKCDHTSCDQCGGCPIHSYVKLPQAKVLSRLLPQQFIKLLRKALPMRLRITALVERDLERARGSTKQKPSSADWKIYSDAVVLALKEVLSYRSATRSHCWTIRYDAPNSYIELKVFHGRAQWLFYAKPQRAEPANSRARQLLKYPFARMHIYGPNILEGALMLCMPVKLTFDIEISGQGRLTRSWESKLGLMDPKFADKQVPTSLRISLGPAEAECVDFDISGNYELLQDCGTASGSLHKKSGSASPNLYLFLDPDRIGNPLDDQFVFSTDKQRLSQDEVRYTIARLAPSWRPTGTFESQKTSCTVHGQWVHCKAALSAVSCERSPLLSVPYENTVISMATPTTVGGTQGACTSSYAPIVSCKVPLRATEVVEWPQGDWAVKMEAAEDGNLSTFTWLTEKIRDLGGFTNGWRELALPPGLHGKCCSCAPERPDIKWRLDDGKIMAYEDPREAGVYERATKSRPAPFLLRAGIDEQRVGCLSIGLNITTLAHRALAKLAESLCSADTHVSWRLDTQYEPYPAPMLSRLKLRHNKNDLEAHYRFPNNEDGARRHVTEMVPELRIEQKRSLTWMIEQENDRSQPFLEEETEEATLRALGWRAEVRARRPVLVHGGILADEVGYGKTATTLALIDSQSVKAESSAETIRRGCISIKATLIMVPRTLICQWKRQIRTFLGQKYKVLVLDTMTAFGKQTVGDFQAADIIIASWALFSHGAYLRLVSNLAALPEPSATDGRAFSAWFAKAAQRIANHTEELKSAPPKDSVPTLQARFAEAWNDENLNRSVPSKRLRGSVYAAAAQAKNVSGLTNKKRKLGDMDGSHPGSQADTFTDCEIPPWEDSFELEDAKELNQVRNPIFQMFHFNRIVIDEFTYVDGKNYAAATSLKAHSRWVLSGTPPLDDFADIKTIAGFLGINLGVDDDTSGVIKGLNIKAIRKERTSAEHFQAFNSVHSLAWHQRRHEHAQRFLDKFARQNTPEIGEIPFEENFRVSRLPAAEYAIYMELQQQLQAQDMRIRKGGKAIIDGDRARRSNVLLGTSRSAAEALIKRCSQFTPEASSRTAHDACNVIIANRRKQYDDLSEDLTRVLRHATWLESVCGGKDEHFGKWTQTASKAYGDIEVTTALSGKIEFARSSCHNLIEDEFYRARLSPAREKEIAEAMAIERKEQLANGKAAKSMSKKKTGGKSKGKGKASSTEPSDNSTEFEVGKAPCSPSGDHRPIKFKTNDYTGKVKALRHLVGVLRSLSLELVARIRAHRFFSKVLEMQEWHSTYSEECLEKKGQPICSGCGKEAEHPTKTFILGMCGHIVCQECLLSPDRGAKCLASGCDAAGHDCNALRASELGSETSDADEDCHYGNKIGDIVRLLKDRVGKDEQAILFVQFDDLMGEIAAALEEQNIGHFALTQKSGLKHGKMMDDFQQDASAAKKKVLLLNPTDQSAAGANLTKPNHVIFVSPLLTTTQHEYDASMTQSIGRARRYGQTNVVQIHRFLSLKTVDVDVLEHRSGKILCTPNEKDFVLKDDESIELESERSQRWGSGIDKSKIFGTFQ